MSGRHRELIMSSWIVFLLGGVLSGCIQERWQRSLYLIGITWQDSSSIVAVWDVEREKYLHNPYDPVTPYDAFVLASVTLVQDRFRLDPTGVPHQAQRTTSTCTGNTSLCFPLRAGERFTSVGGNVLVICGSRRCEKYGSSDIHQREEIPIITDGMRALRLSRSGRYLAVTYTDRTELWDLVHAQKIRSWDQPMGIYWSSRYEDRFCSKNGLFDVVGDTLALLPVNLPCVGVGPQDSLTVLDTVLGELRLFDLNGNYGRSVSTNVEISDILRHGVRWNNEGKFFLAGHMLFDAQGRPLFDFSQHVNSEGGLR